MGASRGGSSPLARTSSATLIPGGARGAWLSAPGTKPRPAPLMVHIVLQEAPLPVRIALFGVFLAATSSLALAQSSGGGAGSSSSGSTGGTSSGTSTSTAPGQPVAPAQTPRNAGIADAAAEVRGHGGVAGNA